MPTYRTQLGNALKVRHLFSQIIPQLEDDVAFSSFGFATQDYLNASALYTATLEDLQSQLAFIEAKIRKNTHSEKSATLQRVLQKVRQQSYPY